MSEHNSYALDAAIALITETAPDIGSVWRHRKGGVYRAVANAIRESDLAPVVVYRDEYPQGKVFDGKIPLVWVRPLTEFTDGRFVLMASAPKSEG